MKARVKIPNSGRCHKCDRHRLFKKDGPTRERKVLRCKTGDLVLSVEGKLVCGHWGAIEQTIIKRGDQEKKQ